MRDKPFAPACERNREPILAELEKLLAADAQIQAPVKVLEVGSGTGQHAVFFARELAHLAVQWQPTELRENLPGIRQWLVEEPAANCLDPVALDLAQPEWPRGEYDMLFTANTLHIVAWPLVETLLAGASRVLRPGGLLVIYGPFNYSGHYTSDSNREFDGWLKQRDVASGIRDFEAIEKVARAQAPVLECIRDIAMPANNRLLVFARQ